MDIFEEQTLARPERGNATGEDPRDPWGSRAACNPKAWALATPSPGEFCLLQQMRKGRTEETAEIPQDKRQTRETEREVEKQRFYVGPASGHRGELKKA